jgi:hypothetical protein
MAGLRSSIGADSQPGGNFEKSSRKRTVGELLAWTGWLVEGSATQARGSKRVCDDVIKPAAVPFFKKLRRSNFCLLYGVDGLALAWVRLKACPRTLFWCALSGHDYLERNARLEDEHCTT